MKIVSEQKPRVRWISVAAGVSFALLWFAFGAATVVPGSHADKWQGALSNGLALFAGLAFGER
jgi:hypothetical protein